MQDFLMQAYQFGVVLLPCLLVYAVSRWRGVPADGRRLIALLLFAAFITGVFQVTGAGTVYELKQMITLHIPCKGFSLLPFSEEINPVGYALNVVMLVPFGFLAPLIWPQLAKWWRAALAGLSFSLLIELSQLVNYRSSDVDDLILNTLGAALGYVLFRLYIRLTHRELPPTIGRGYEPALYIGAMFLSWFLLFNGLGAAMLMYGF